MSRLINSRTITCHTPWRDRRRGQRGAGLVEVLVASVLLAVALIVLLGALSPLLAGSTIAERQTVAARFARSVMERQMARTPACTGRTRTTSPIDGTVYQVSLTANCPGTGYVEYTVTVRDPSGNGMTLTNDKVLP
jgi:Tfp pilus assembly protein PilV